MIIKRQVYVKIDQKPAEKGKTCTVYWCVTMKKILFQR